MSNWSVKQQLREEILEAAVQGDSLKVGELLDKGADVNESEGGYLSKKTVLLVAIENRNEEVAKLLVDRGADLTVTVTVTGKKKTVVDLARDKELNTLADYIQNIQGLNERLMTSVMNGADHDAVDVIMKGAKVNIMYTPTELDQPDCTLLQLALVRGHLAVAKVLIHYNIDLHAVMKWDDQSEDTARSYADRMNYDEIVSMIDAKLKESSNENKTMANGDGGNQHKTNFFQTNNNTGQSKTVEVYDIEDAEEIQPEAEVPVMNGSSAKKHGNGCTVS
ncbi:uncharacterized protein [Diadema setosum]|uniref:uncharacterized protein n=1 Tax=Diadema setosum TaxID=31175 RepID=UPI003B3B7B0C